MYLQAFLTSLRILFFLAGPEDLPYDKSQRLTFACVVFALVTYLILFSLAVSPLFAILPAVINVAMLALMTQLTLRSRGFGNRFQQTFNALLITTSLLTLVLVPFFVKVMPVWIDLVQKATQDPDVLNHPEQFPALEAQFGNVLAICFFLLWQLVVIAYIFVKAAGTKALFILIGIFIVMTLLRAALGSAGPV